MEWQIPEPLSIRPCEKPSDFKARQLSLYPVKLRYPFQENRKLPQWVDEAGFEPTFTKTKEEAEPLINNHEILTENEHYFTLHNKYKSKHKYVLRYERGEEKYQFNENFAHEYIPTNYSILENHVEEEKRHKEESTTEKEEDEGMHLEGEKKNFNIEFDSKFECGNLSKVYQGNFLLILKEKMPMSTIE